MPDFTCTVPEVGGHAFSPWIAKVFHDCVYTPMDYASFICGWASIFVFLFDQWPQLITSCKTRTVHGLSFIFMFAWIMGDVTNLVGCILGDQLPTQTYLGVYFVTTDTLWLIQYFYFYYFHPPQKIIVVDENGSVCSDDNGSVSSDESPPRSSLYSVFVMLAVFSSSRLLLLGPRFSAPLSASSRRLLSTSGAMSDAVAGVIAWCSGMLYYTARLPQIYRNYKLKSTRGLSLHMFLMTFGGNGLYGLSILLRLPVADAHFFQTTLAYVIGSVGTMPFDIALMVQFWKYNSNHARDPLDDAEQSLLDESAA